MDDAKKGLSLSFLVLIATAAVLGSQAAAGAELEYISPEQRERFSKQFAEASKPAANADTSTWTCDMYGVRTGLQVKRGLKLYGFTQQDTHIQNSGAHPIATYRATDNEWIGANEKVEDHIRMTADGRLITQLRTPGAGGAVLAYSICRR